MYAFFIDSLAENSRMMDPQATCFRTRFRINSLSYADDTLFLTRNGTTMKRLLGVCENLAVSNKHLFARIKYVILEPEDSDDAYKIHGDVFPKANEFKYMGVVFSSKGISAQRHVAELEKKCMRVASFFGNINMHAGDWHPAASRRIYLRITLENGIAALGVKKRDVIKVLERA